MTVEEIQNLNAEPPVVDSGISVPDPEQTAASGWQITLAAALVVAILSVFFYGVTNQRLEVAGSKPAAQQASNVPPARSAPPATASTSTKTARSSTTGQAPHDAAPKPANAPGAPRAQQPQNAGSPNVTQPASAPQKNQ